MKHHSPPFLFASAVLIRVLLSGMASFSPVAGVSAEVTPAMAIAAAKAWSVANGSLSAGRKTIGGSAVANRDADGTLLWYEVPMTGGGCVIVSPDTGIEPVIAVLDNCGDGIPQGHPLRAMLTRDMRGRLAACAAGDSGADGAGAACTAASRKWAGFLGDTASSTKGGLAGTTAARAKTKAVSASGEIVPDRLWSYLYEWAEGGLDHWNQEGWNWYVTTNTLYNAYTPNHYPAGCVATAGAALLQFYNITTAPRVTQTCHVNGSATNLTTKAVNYDWSLLEDVTWDRLTDAQRDLVGRATYDMGVCLGMSYRKEASSAPLLNLATVLRTHFGFADARYAGNIRPEHFEKLIYNPVRCGLPVVLGMGDDDEAKSATSGGKSHAVLAVGCGEDDDGTVYTRVFMGWGGVGDAWYALPTVAEYNVVDDVVTMIGTTKDVVPICGRVNTTAGDGVAFETVTIDDVRKIKTLANGFFSTRYNRTASSSHKVSCRGVSKSVTFAAQEVKNYANAKDLAALLPDTLALTVAPAAGELKVYNSPIKARMAALALGKALFILSGADWCSDCGIVKDYIKGCQAEFTSNFVFYYCNIDCDPYGMAMGSSDYGVFDPRVFEPSLGWAKSNGRLAFDSGGDKEKVRAVLDAGLAAWKSRDAAPTSVVVDGPVGIMAPSQYVVKVTYPDGTVSSLTDGVTWAISSGSAATLSKMGLLTPVAGKHGNVTVQATVALWGEAYTPTMSVRILSPAFVTKLAVSGPELIDLYDEAGGRYTATALCEDGTSVEVIPEWTVKCPDASYETISPHGELSFSSDTYTVYQCATATVTAVYGDFTATAQTVIYGPGYVCLTEYDLPQNAIWPGCTFEVTPKTVRWWRHGVLEEPTNDLSNVAFSWELSCPGDEYRSGEGASITVPDAAFSTNGQCMVYVSSRPDRKRHYDTRFVGISLHFLDEESQMVTVSFDANGGTSSFASMRYAAGKPYRTLPELSRTGYNGSWYTELEGGEEVKLSSTAPETRRATLYAQWSPIYYGISFDPNGGTGSMDDLSLYYDETAKLPPLAFRCEGYSFAGWSLSRGGAVDFADEASVVNLRDTHGEVTLYAVWNKLPITSPVTGLAVTGPTLIDLYDKAGGRYTASVVCEDGSSVEVTPEWSVECPDANYEQISFRGELSFTSDTYTVTQCATATVSAVYGGFKATKQTVIYGPGYVCLTEYDLPQNAIWPGCTFEVTPKTVRWWRHGVLEEPTNDLSNVAFSWELSCPGDEYRSGEGASFTVPDAAFSTNGQCTVYVSSRPDRKRHNGNRSVDFSLHFLDEKPKMVSVSFDANDGTSSFSSMQYAAGKPYLTLPTLSRTGYHGQWHTQPDGGDLVHSSSNAPANRATLYAQWSPVRYWISFDPNGGTGSMDDLYLDYDETADLRPLAFRLEGYSFAGWARSPGGAVEYADEQSVVNLRDTSGEVKLYAVWNELPITSSVTGLMVSGPELIDLYDVTGGRYTASVLCEDGSSVEVTPEWSVECPDANYEQISFRGELSFSSDTYTVYQCATATVTAVYGGFTATAQTVIYGPGYVSIETFDIPQNALWPGCTFGVTPKTVRWWRHGVLEEPTDDLANVAFSWELFCSGDENRSGAGASFTVPDAAFSTNGQCSVYVSARPDRDRYYGEQSSGMDLHFLAEEPQMVSVSFDANDGTSSFASMRYAAGLPYLFLPNLSRVGYVGSWQTEFEGGEYVNSDSNAPSADATLHAQWIPIWVPEPDPPVISESYTIAFDANGGAGEMTPMTVTCGSAATLPWNAFTRKNYVFIGWSTTAWGDVEFVNLATAYNLTTGGNTVTLYAKWAKKSYKVKFYANGGKGKMALEKMTYGKSKRLTANKFTRDGYKFKGWATSKSKAKKGKVAYKNKKKVKNLVANGKTVKLYAVWKRR